MKYNNLLDSVRHLLMLKTNERILINGRYSCKLTEKVPFKVFERNQNCPSYESSAFVTITNTDTIARIDVNYNVDLNNVSCMLVFYNFNDQPISMTTITDLEFFK